MKEDKKVQNNKKIDMKHDDLLHALDEIIDTLLVAEGTAVPTKKEVPARSCSALIEYLKEVSLGVARHIKKTETELATAMIDDMTGFFAPAVSSNLLEKRLKDLLETGMKINLAEVPDEIQKAGVACLIFFDANNLKNINDHYGHAEGDFFLKTVTKCMQSGFRKDDLYCRYAGDEFFVLADRMNKRTAEVRMLAVQKTIQKEVEKRRQEKGYPDTYQFSISYGMVEVDIKEIIAIVAPNILAAAAKKVADRKMYVYKNSYKEAIINGKSPHEAFAIASASVEDPSNRTKSKEKTTTTQ